MRTARVAVAIVAITLASAGARAHAQQSAPDEPVAEPVTPGGTPDVTTIVPPPAEAPPPAPTEGKLEKPAELPASAAPAPSIPAPTPPPRMQGAPQIGIAPGTPQAASSIVGEGPMPAPGVSTAPSSGEWKFDFHGYLRAPMRVGFGSGDDSAPGIDKGGKLHVPPQIPDGTFTDWRYTNNLFGPWAELRFSYGNQRVTGNVLIAAYNITEGGYRNLQSQLGIDQAFVTIDEADLLPGKGGLVWNVGVFQNRYGAAGRYDAGKYDTYLFGRTHVVGETLTAFYHLSDLLTVTLEHGIGAKFEKSPLISGQPDTPYLPYAGPVQQGGQLVHHAHAMLSIGDNVQVGAHYMTTWTDDARLADEKDGRITTFGGDVKLIDSRFGDGYIGYSRLNSRTPLRLGDGLEMIHSVAGWNLRDNYFGNMSTGSGSIDTILFQHVLSVSKLVRYPEPFWGQGPDLLLSLFGMFNHVKSDDPMFAGAKNKFKWGAEATYLPWSWLGGSLRYDMVQPDLDDSTLSFSALSPKIILRSQFVTHEQIIIQYTRYFYGDHVSPAWPAIGLLPDKDAFMIAAIMWW